MAELKALIFDVDGTLADTEKDGHRVAFNAAFKDAGLDWDWDVALYGELLAVTGGKERMRHFIAGWSPMFEAPEDMDAWIAGLHRSKTEHYTQLLSEGAIPLRPGVERLLNEARDAGIRLAIATTTTPANVTALLEHTLGPESLDWFEVIAAGDIVPAKKPAPDIYTWALDKMRLGPAESIAFEDSGNGVLSAVDAGIDNIVVTVNDYTTDHDFRRASVVLDGFGEPGRPPKSLAGNGAPLPDEVVDLSYLRGLHQHQQ